MTKDEIIETASRRSPLSLAYSAVYAAQHEVEYTCWSVVNSNDAISARMAASDALDKLRAAKAELQSLLEQRKQT